MLDSVISDISVTIRDGNASDRQSVGQTDSAALCCLVALEPSCILGCVGWRPGLPEMLLLYMMLLAVGGLSSFVASDVLHLHFSLHLQIRSDQWEELVHLLLRLSWFEREKRAEGIFPFEVFTRLLFLSRHQQHDDRVWRRHLVGVGEWWGVDGGG